MKEWITVEEAARILGKTRRTVWRKIKAGELRTLEEPKKGNRSPRLVSREEVLRLKEPPRDLPVPLLPDLEAAIRNVTRDVTRQTMSQQAAEIVTSMSQGRKRTFRLYILFSGVMTAALVTLAALYVTRQAVTTGENFREVVTSMSQAQNRAQEATREALEAELAEARREIAALEAAGRADREAIRAGEEATRAEIRELRAIIEIRGEGLAAPAQRPPMVTPTSAPSPSPGPEPETTPAARSRFLGIF